MDEEEGYRKLIFYYVLCMLRLGISIVRLSAEYIPALLGGSRFSSDCDEVNHIVLSSLICP